MSSGHSIPLVSVVCTTYNHENYIEETIKGFLIQQTDFPIEIIIHDDASTDNTVDVIKKYEKEYPHLFNNIYQSENQYSKGVDIWANLFANKCQGKYIAICEGDDFWTDPLKLYKQVTFLENHTDYGLVYGKVKHYIQHTGRYGRIFGWEIVDLNFLLKGNVIPTLTVCFRQNLYVDYLTEIQPQNQGWKMGDYPIWLWIAGNSKMGFINEIQGIYRVLSESASHSKDLQRQIDFIESYANIKKRFVQIFSVTDKDVLESIDEQYLMGLFRVTINLNGDHMALTSALKNSAVSTLKLRFLRTIVKSRFLCKLLAYLLS